MGLLQGESAIVTGAGQGIGRAIARMFASEGARVVVADIVEEAAVQVAAEINQEFGNRSVGLRVDIGCENDVTAAAETCVEMFGSITLLVNNAGVYAYAPVLDMTRETLERVFRVNVTGTFLMTQTVARRMVAAKRGKIINISSCSARKADFGQAAYNASKSAIIGLTRVTALELGPYGVSCNAVLPGATDTEMTRASFLRSPEVERDWMEKTALKRLGTPDDIARAVLFLASHLSDHVTGESLVVSAGELMTQ